jgi:hypothetical protein
MTSPTPHILLQSATAPKVGIRSSGSVRYQILSDADHMEIYLAITGNEGGTGYFSPLPIAFSAIQACIVGIPAGQALTAKTFKKAAFTVSRSTNGAGFVTAILRGLGLLAPAENAPHKHVIAGDWAAWKSEQLRAVVPVVPTPDSPLAGIIASTRHDDSAGSESIGQRKEKKSRKKPEDLHHHPTVSPEDVDAEPA